MLVVRQVGAPCAAMVADLDRSPSARGVVTPCVPLITEQ